MDWSTIIMNAFAVLLASIIVYIISKKDGKNMEKLHNLKKIKTEIMKAIFNLNAGINIFYNLYMGKKITNIREVKDTIFNEYEFNSISIANEYCKRKNSLITTLIKLHPKMQNTQNFIYLLNELSISEMSIQTYTNNKIIILDYVELTFNIINLLFEAVSIIDDKDTLQKQILSMDIFDKYREIIK
jgi:hypothetical protein